jgi:hypothetical protein
MPRNPNKKNAGLAADLIGDYKAVAAGSTDAICGTTGAAGDLIKGIVIVPAAATGLGVVSIKDGNGSAINIFAGGTLADVKSFYIEIGALSQAGPWKVTTGASVSALVIGNFV